MADESQYDVLLSHSAKDKAVVRPLAERLQVAVRQHLKVWFDEWVLKPAVPLAHRIGEGSGVRAAKIEAGPYQWGTRSSEFRTPKLCLSAQAFGSGWAQLEAGTCGRRNLPFRDPLNQERRFIPLRLDDAKLSLRRGSPIVRKSQDAKHKIVACSRRALLDFPRTC